MPPWARRPRRRSSGLRTIIFIIRTIPKNKAFAKAFRDAYKREPKVGALYGYITAHFIVQALAKAGKMDREKFIDALERMKVDTPGGRSGDARL